MMTLFKSSKIETLKKSFNGNQEAWKHGFIAGVALTIGVEVIYNLSEKAYDYLFKKVEEDKKLFEDNQQ